MSVGTNIDDPAHASYYIFCHSILTFSHWLLMLFCICSLLVVSGGSDKVAYLSVVQKSPKKLCFSIPIHIRISISITLPMLVVTFPVSLSLKFSFFVLVCWICWFWLALVAYLRFFSNDLSQDAFLLCTDTHTNACMFIYTFIYLCWWSSMCCWWNSMYC